MIPPRFVRIATGVLAVAAVAALVTAALPVNAGHADWANRAAVREASVQSCLVGFTRAEDEAVRFRALTAEGEVIAERDIPLAP